MDFKKIRIKPVWPKSKEVIWDEMSVWLDEQTNLSASDTVDGYRLIHARPEKKGLLRRIPLWGYAASLLIPVLLICSFYTVTESAARGEQAAVQLPDRSTVTLNAESKLSYKPVAWFFARIVKLEGEAFFEVKPGSRFSVHTGDSRVNVLGTTFNVYARPGAYRVTCLSGRVEVQAGEETVALNPNMQATLHERGLSVANDVIPSMVTGWVQGMFVFAGTPLGEVIAEIERRYDIHVFPDYDASRLYSGTFEKTESPYEILEYIGKAFGITFRIDN